jgi:hypothetical protein
MLKKVQKSGKKWVKVGQNGGKSIVLQSRIKNYPLISGLTIKKALTAE